jgi:spermidine/putrescine ABC transporter ATP-binding subunit
MSDTGSAPSIEARSLLKRHGNVLAVDRVSLTVSRGEFFSILGPSGAGKSSILRMLAGFEHPDEGEIRIDGRSMAGVPPNRRPVNMVFQSYALFPHLSVLRNVAFGLEMQGAARRDIDARVDAMLELTQLQHTRDRLPAQLSGGEQQRVALARALVNRPAVVLLDEPLSALDEQLRQEMQAELKAVQERVGVTFVCVTHHQAEALSMSDRVAVMDRGRILQVGRPEDIYEAPAELFVARFVGLSNELRGTVVECKDGEGRLQPSATGGEISGLRPIRVPVGPGIAQGAAATFVIRPERLRFLSKESQPAGENYLHGAVEKRFYTGHRIHFVVRIAESVRWQVGVSNEAQSQTLPAVGARVCVAWNPPEGVLFRE